jgi:predicted ferric reductase
VAVVFVVPMTVVHEIGVAAARHRLVAACAVVVMVRVSAVLGMLLLVHVLTVSAAMSHRRKGRAHRLATVFQLLESVENQIHATPPWLRSACFAGFQPQLA